MGINGLLPLINKHSGSYSVKDYPIEKFNGMTVAVDVSLLIHQIILGIRARGSDMVNNEGKITSHLYGIFFKINNLLKHNITPILVFDGDAPKIKKKTLEKRKAIKDKAIKEIKELGDNDVEQKNKLNQRTFEMTEDIINQCKIMLDLMGIPYIQSPEEADVVCAWLTVKRNGKRYAKGVSSEDSDILALGGRYLFRNMTKTDANKVTVINLEKTLTRMKFSLKKFQELCVLMGCDYCKNIPGVGPTRALNLLKTNKNMEEVFETLGDDPKYKIEKQCMFEAREYFMNSVSQLSSSGFTIRDDQIRLRKCQKEKLLDFLFNTHNFSLKVAEKRIDDLLSYQKIMNVTLENTTQCYKLSGKALPITINSINFSETEY